MKKYIGIFLLLSLLLPFSGTFLWLQYQKISIQKETKRDMLSHINKKDLVLLSFTPEEAKKKLKWEHSKEFEYQGQMYDIVSVEVDDGKIKYWCWADNKETHLNKKLKALVAQKLGNDPTRKNKNQALFYFLKTLYFTSDNELSSFQFKLKSTHSFNYLCEYVSISIPPAFPPPCSV